MPCSGLLVWALALTMASFIAVTDAAEGSLADWYTKGTNLSCFYT